MKGTRHSEEQIIAILSTLIGPSRRSAGYQQIGSSAPLDDRRVPESFNGSGWSAIVEAGITGLCLLFAEPSQIVLPRLLATAFSQMSPSRTAVTFFTTCSLTCLTVRQLVRPVG